MVYSEFLIVNSNSVRSCVVSGYIAKKNIVTNCLTDRLFYNNLVK